MDEQVLEKLDILIKLTAANVIKEDKTQTESILKLNGVGIKYRDIARILGASDSYVALIISKNKSKNKKKEDISSELGKAEESANETTNIES